MAGRRRDRVPRRGWSAPARRRSRRSAARPDRPGAAPPGAPPIPRRGRRWGRGVRSARRREIETALAAQRGDHAVAGAGDVEDRPGDALVERRQPLHLVPDLADRVEPQVAARGGRPARRRSSSRARPGPGGTSFWPSRLIRPSMLVVVPGRSCASAAGSTTSASSSDRPGEEATATTKSAPSRARWARPAIGEVGQRDRSPAAPATGRRGPSPGLGGRGQDGRRVAAPGRRDRAPGLGRTRPGRPRG